MTLPALIMVAGKRWPVEECHQQGKGQTGLDQHQVRTWHSFCRHTVLSMCAQALLAIAAARRLLRLATTPMSQAARDLGYAWSRWRRRHQARARWHHYHAQLKAARVTRPRGGRKEALM